jgi:hypothetical protein
MSVSSCGVRAGDGSLPEGGHEGGAADARKTQPLAQVVTPVVAILKRPAWQKTDAAGVAETAEQRP